MPEQALSPGVEETQPTPALRVAVVGLGWWGRTIVPLLKGSYKLRVVKGVDPAPAGAEFAAAPRDAHLVLVRIVHRDAEAPQAILHAPVVVGFTGKANDTLALRQGRERAVTQRQRLAAGQRGFEMKRALLPGLEIDKCGVNRGGRH